MTQKEDYNQRLSNLREKRANLRQTIVLLKVKHKQIHRRLQQFTNEIEYINNHINMIKKLAEELEECIEISSDSE